MTGLVGKEGEKPADLNMASEPTGLASQHEAGRLKRMCVF